MVRVKPAEHGCASSPSKGLNEVGAQRARDTHLSRPPRGPQAAFGRRRNIAVERRQIGEPLNVSYRECGAAHAPSVFMLHGIGSNSSGYRRQLAALAGEFRLIAWDAPGYGESDPLAAGTPSVDDYAAVALELLTALDIPRCCVTGSSMGALIAATMAAIAPDRVSSMVLCAPTLGYGGLPTPERDRLTTERIAAMRELGPSGLAEARAPLLLASRAPAEVHAIARELLAALHPASYEQAARMLGSADLGRSLGRIEAQTTILCGTEDRITPLETSATPIHEGIAGSQLTVIPEVGHMLKLEAPEMVNAAIRAAATAAT